MRIEIAQNNTPIRIVSGNTPIYDDLDPRVIFTSEYPPGVAEIFETTVSVGQNEVSGSFILAHDYNVPPACFGVMTRSDGTIVYPFGYCFSQVTNTTTNTWIYEADYFLVHSTTNRAYWEARKMSGALTYKIRLFVLG